MFLRHLLVVIRVVVALYQGNVVVTASSVVIVVVPGFAVGNGLVASEIGERAIVTHAPLLALPKLHLVLMPSMNM